MKLTPTVLWAQTSDSLLLTIELSKVEDVKCEITDESISFSCVKGSDEYSFEFKFFKPVKSSDVQKAVDRFIRLKLQKQVSESWTSLNSCGKKHYIKCDWDRWVDSEADDEDSFSGMPNFGDFGGFDGMDDMDDLEDSDEEISGLDENFKKPEDVNNCGCCSSCNCGPDCKCTADSKCSESCTCGTKSASEVGCSPTCSCAPGRCGPKCDCTPSAKCSEECTC